MSTTPILRETEIRPDHLMAEQARRFAADVERLLGRKSEFVPVPCPACGADEPRPTFRKHDLDYVTCPQCATLYISPRPIPEVLEMYYTTSENYAFWNTHIFPASEDARREKIFRPRAQQVAEICTKYGVPRRTLLEVGAGFGTFCEELKSLGLFDRLLAVEPTPGLAETCRSRGIEVIEKPIEHVDLQGAVVDVVASFEVMEHLFAPAEFVKQCARLLARGGLFIATCPNGQGFDVATLQALSNTVDPEHLNYFNPASLSRLVEAHGFTVLEVRTPGKLDAELVRKQALAGRLDLSAQPFLRHVLVEDWDELGAAFQEFLATNCLSSHMWLVARRD